MQDVIIIGVGPAGIAASLYLQRGSINTLLIGRDFGALEKAHEIENFYGFVEPIKGEDLVQRGIDQALRLGAKYVKDEVVSIQYDGSYIVKTPTQDFRAKKLILATGVNRGTPNIKGLKDLEGKGVSYCAVCDGFFYRNKTVAILGNGEYAIEEAEVLKPLAKEVIILTNGKDMIKDTEFKVIKEPIVALNGTEKVEKIVFKNNEELKVDGIFVAEGIAGSVAFAKKLGAAIEGNKIITDDLMATSIPNLYAIGDARGGLLQISKAVYEGSLLGLELVKEKRRASIL